MLALAACAATAQTAPDPASDPQREQREQIEQWRRQAQRPAELPRSPAAPAWLPPLTGEQPCIVLQSVHVAVAADGAPRPSPAVPAALREPPADFLGPCIGVGSLHRLQSNLQGRLHALGYLTSSLELTEQDLQNGVLRLALHWGRLGRVRVQHEGSGAGQAGALAGNSLALRPGEVLNLRDIEHTLENLARLPSQAARFVIEPGSAPHESDLRIVVAQQPRWRGSLGLDAADVHRDSPWDLQAQVWLDAPFGWSDQLMVSASTSPEAEGELRSHRDSLYAAWSLPWGRHLVSLSAASARHGRSIAGGVGRFTERGEEQQAALRWQWTPWRGPDWRTPLWAAWGERRSRSRIDDVELISRRRIASELSLGAAHWRRLGCGEASLEVESTHTRRLARAADFQDLQAPKPRTWRIQADWRCAWAPGPGDDVRGAWAAAISAWLHAVERPFDGSDLLAVGSRHTVRGHSADQALQGERIGVVRASLSGPGQRWGEAVAWQAWMGWDIGRVERAVARAAVGAPAPRTLQAALLGLRWWAGPVSGELSWARALGRARGPPGGQWQTAAVWWF